MSTTYPNIACTPANSKTVCYSVSVTNGVQILMKVPYRGNCLLEAYKTAAVQVQKTDTIWVAVHRFIESKLSGLPRISNTMIWKSWGPNGPEVKQPHERKWVRS